MTKDERIGAALKQRRNDCLQRATALQTQDDDAIHAFRLGCKRLRYAIELFAVPGLEPQAQALSALADELGFAHDCVELARRATAMGADALARRASQDRARYLDAALKHWQALAPQLQEPA